MRTTFLITLLSLSFAVKSEVPLSDKSINNLVSLGLACSVNPTDDETYFAQLDSLRTEELNGIVDCMIAMGHADTSIMNVKYLSRPSDGDLVYWEVIYKIRGDNSPTSFADHMKMAEAELNSVHDPNLLIHHYYSMLYSSIAMLFNETDLSDYNIEINKLGFKNDSEKAIFYFDFTKSFTDRFLVLQNVGNYAKLRDFIKQLPSINGNPYYFYTKFNYADFEWTENELKTTFNQAQLERFYTILLIHMDAMYDANKSKAASDVFYNSILNMPEYFQYSGSQKELKSLYKRMNAY